MVWAIALLVALALATLAGCAATPPSALSLTATAAATLTPSATLTATATPSSTATPTLTNTPTATCTPTATATPTQTATPSATPTFTATPTALATPDGTPRVARVPILMYHYISESPDPDDALRVDLSISPERFAEHVRYLYLYGYDSITLDDLTRALTCGAALQEKPVILTFDDGYVDHYMNAYPALVRYRMTGTFFVITGFLDEGRDGFLSWEQASELHAAGMALGAHSFSHPDLRNRDVDYLVWQTLGPKEAIEARTGEPVRWFCYPSGRYDDQVIAVLKSAGYWGAVTTMPGIEHHADGMFDLVRIRVRDTLSGPDLLDLIELYNDQPSDPDDAELYPAERYDPAEASTQP